jgi:hypothetical protein
MACSPVGSSVVAKPLDSAVARQKARPFRSSGMSAPVDATLTVEQAHRIAHDVEQELVQSVPRLPSTPNPSAQPRQHTTPSHITADLAWMVDGAIGADGATMRSLHAGAR